MIVLCLRRCIHMQSAVSRRTACPKVCNPTVPALHCQADTMQLGNRDVTTITHALLACITQAVACGRGCGAAPARACGGRRGAGLRQHPGARAPGAGSRQRAGVGRVAGCGAGQLCHRVCLQAAHVSAHAVMTVCLPLSVTACANVHVLYGFERLQCARFMFAKLSVLALRYRALV